MANSIKISGDLSGLKKQILELPNFMKRTLGKSNISLLDKNSQKIISGEAAKIMGQLETRAGRLRALMGEYAKRAADASGDARKELEYKNKLITVTQKLVSLEKDRERLSDLQGQIKGGGFSKGLGKSAGNIPYLGTIAKGLTTPMGLGLLAGGALIGAGAYGVSRLSAGYDRYSAGLDSRIKLMGRGAYDTDMHGSRRMAFSQVGMDEEAVRAARLQSMDIFGAKGSSQGAVLGRAQFARNYGVDLDTLQGMGSGMRAQTGTKGANRDMMKLQASLQASEIKDAIGPYLETTASMLTDIRQDGLVNSGEVMSLMATLSRMTGNSSERTAAQIAGFQKAVQGSSGENNAFFQTAFSRAGIGKGSIGGAQAAIRSGGIFGLNMDDYGGLSGDSRKTLESLGIAGKGTGFQERVGSIMNLADQTFSGGGPQSKLAKARFMMPKLGAKNEVEAMEIMDEFKAAQKSGDMGRMSKLEEKLKNNNASPEERMLTNLEKINKSQEGQVQSLQVIRRIQEEYLGKQVAPAAMMMSKALLHIDELIGGIYNGLASILPGMETTAQKMSGAMSGATALTDAQAEEIRGGGKGAVNKAGTGMVVRQTELEGELAAAKKRRDFDAMVGNKGALGADDSVVKSLEQQIANLNANFDKLIGVNKEHVEVAKEGATAAKRTSRAVSKPQATVEAGSGKTR